MEIKIISSCVCINFTKYITGQIDTGDFLNKNIYTLFPLHIQDIYTLHLDN